MWIDRKLTPLLPPNVNARSMRNLMLALLLACVLASTAVFLGSYMPSYRALYRYYWWSNARELEPTAIMAQFWTFATPTVWITLGLAALALAAAALLYSSYYQESRSIYLMRRLPEGRGLLHRQVWSVPLLTVALVLAVGALTLLGTWLVWRFVTPQQCLPTPENIQRASDALAASYSSAYYSAYLS